MGVDAFLETNLESHFLMNYPKVSTSQMQLNLSQTYPGFYVSAVQVFRKTLWEKEKLLVISPFPTVFSIGLENFLPFSSNLK